MVSLVVVVLIGTLYLPTPVVVVVVASVPGASGLPSVEVVLFCTITSSALTATVHVPLVAIANSASAANLNL